MVSCPTRSKNLERTLIQRPWPSKESLESRWYLTVFWWPPNYSRLPPGVRSTFLDHKFYKEMFFVVKQINFRSPLLVYFFFKKLIFGGWILFLKMARNVTMDLCTKYSKFHYSTLFAVWQKVSLFEKISKGLV